MPRVIFGYPNGKGGGAAGIWCVEARDAAKLLQSTGQHLTTWNYLPEP